jgi:hypothetical protein
MNEALGRYFFSNQTAASVKSFPAMNSGSPQSCVSGVEDKAFVGSVPRNSNTSFWHVKFALISFWRKKEKIL